MPPCALALGKFEVADPRGTRLQRKSGWWWKWCVSGKGWEQREDGSEGQAMPGVCAGPALVVQGGARAQSKDELRVGGGGEGPLLNPQLVAAFVHWSSKKHFYPPVCSRFWLGAVDTTGCPGNGRHRRSPCMEASTGTLSESLTLE